MSRNKSLSTYFFIHCFAVSGPLIIFPVGVNFWHQLISQEKCLFIHKHSSCYLSAPATHSLFHPITTCHTRLEPNSLSCLFSLSLSCCSAIISVLRSSVNHLHSLSPQLWISRCLNAKDCLFT